MSTWGMDITDDTDMRSMASAAHGGHLKMLRRISARQPSAAQGVFSDIVWVTAGRHGHHDIVDFLFSAALHPLPDPARWNLVDGLVEGGHLDLLRQLDHHKEFRGCWHQLRAPERRPCKFSSLILCAVKFGHVQCAKWLHKQGCRGFTNICSACGVEPKQLTLLLLILREKGLSSDLRQLTIELFLDAANFQRRLQTQLVL